MNSFLVYTHFCVSFRDPLSVTNLFPVKEFCFRLQGEMLWFLFATLLLAGVSGAPQEMPRSTPEDGAASQLDGSTRTGSDVVNGRRSGREDSGASGANTNGFLKIGRKVIFTFRQPGHDRARQGATFNFRQPLTPEGVRSFLRLGGAHITGNDSDYRLNLMQNDTLSDVTGNSTIPDPLSARFGQVPVLIQITGPRDVIPNAALTSIFARLRDSLRLSGVPNGMSSGEESTEPPPVSTTEPPPPTTTKPVKTTRIPRPTFVPTEGTTHPKEGLMLGGHGFDLGGLANGEEMGERVPVR